MRNISEIREDILTVAANMDLLEERKRSENVLKLYVECGTLIKALSTNKEQVLESLGTISMDLIILIDNMGFDSSEFDEVTNVVSDDEGLVLGVDRTLMIGLSRLAEGALRSKPIVIVSGLFMVKHCLAYYRGLHNYNEYDCLELAYNKLYKATKTPIEDE